MNIEPNHTDKEAGRIATIQERAIKIGSMPELCALFDLSDRICMQAMRRGAFDDQTCRMHGAFLPWGEFTGRLKSAVDAMAVDGSIDLPAIPEIPKDVDQDLRFAVSHFARLAGVAVPASWG